MTTYIDQAFVKQFEAGAHLAYQRKGSAIRNTVRTKNNVVGESTTFQTAGKGAAGSKSRHGQVPIMNAERAPVECPINDRYAGEYIDELDLQKIKHDEKNVVINTVSYAFGRDTDEILFTAMDASTNSNNSTTATTWSAPSAPIAIMEYFGKTSIPFDGDLFACVPWEAWGDLMDIDEFSNADYIPSAELWREGIIAKKWLGFNWFPHEMLPKDGSGDSRMFFWHRSAIGHAIGRDLSIDITWQGKEQAWLTVGRMSHGAVIIDQEGVLELTYDITP